MIIQSQQQKSNRSAAAAASICWRLLACAVVFYCVYQLATILLHKGLLRVVESLASEQRVLTGSERALYHKLVEFLGTEAAFSAAEVGSYGQSAEDQAKEQALLDERWAQIRAQGEIISNSGFFVQAAVMNKQEQKRWRDRVKNMFYHAYDSYMHNAFPEDELKPLSCTGHKTWGNYSLTLIDALDTLLVMGNTTEFLKQTSWVVENVNFDKDISVSIFETNIRIVGGLLAAHQCLMHSPLLQRPLMHGHNVPELADAVLVKIRDLVDRMMPAFDTKTGVPYGYINLMHGVASNETDITSVAGGGTHLLEFQLLSLLTGDDKYAQTAHRAAYAFHQARNQNTGLIGNHINIQTGTWKYGEASIGASVDSYFEYLYKGYLAFGIPQYWLWFQDFYASILKHLYKRPWYVDADHSTGQKTWSIFNSLQAFWPGLQAQLGGDQDLEMARETLLNMHSVWRRYGCLPEGYNILAGTPQQGQKPYPLRPELVESTYFLYQKTKDPLYLHVGRDIVHSLEQLTRVPCGFANLRDCELREKEDRMESFFLAETLKYAYLLFDEDNWVNTGEWTFNTEAHLIALRPEYLRMDWTPNVGSLAAKDIPLDKFKCKVTDYATAIGVCDMFVDKE